MRTSFYGYSWKVIPNDFGSISKLPRKSRVYIITIKKEGYKKRTVVYVGVSKNVYCRIKNHPIIRLLRNNLVGYKIEISVRNFTDMFNDRAEKKVISYYEPVFNFTWLAGRKTKLPNFWRNCGVEKINYPKIGRKHHKIYKKINGKLQLSY